jgi:AGZA family xanthine/uracil permease-like MFS transporter
VKDILERKFKLEENKTNIRTEILAGLTTFMSMSYIIFLNPTVLSQTGMDYNAVYAATIIASVIATLVMAFYANVPYALSTGIGLGSLFTYTLCGSMGFTWGQSLAIVYISGILNFLITITSLRKKIVTAIPVFLQNAITVGIGLFITYVGLINAGIITFGADAINNGFATNVIPQLANIKENSILLAIIGLIITIILLLRKSKGAYLKGIIITTLIGIPLGVTTLPDFSNYTLLPSIAPTFMKIDFIGLFSVKTGIVVVLMTIFTMCISDLFDSIGVFIGTGKKAGLFKIDKNGNLPPKLEKAMIADSCGTIIGSIFGTANTTTYLESSVGIEAGGRTGLTSLTVACLFALSLFFSPIIACVPMAAIAPILILIGMSMLESVSDIDWKDLTVAIPSFFTIIVMPFAYSITNGIEFGFIFYALIALICKKTREVSPIIFIFAILFLLKYIIA